ncbi:hypothetical protein Agub_g151, partial [Astrephomene gubernaculifera]
LGSAPGGSLTYIEPPAAVGLNNELAAARGEAAAAEEAVLWGLTARVVEVLHELQDTFRTVVWLDELSARSRYGIWIQGTLPEIVPWDAVFHARGAASMRRKQKAQGAEGADAEGEQADSGLYGGDGDPDERYAVRLRGLRHPLLYGEYLTRKETLERAVRMDGGDSGGGGGGGSSLRSPRRMLSNRKEVMLQQAGLSTSSSFSSSFSSSTDESDADDDETSADSSPRAQLAALRPPRPLDWTVRPDTSAVVITGPNTGGKTAAIKALGLAACMARCGLALPAAAPARLPAFSRVLADIGDEQSLSANLSTFSGHLRRIQALRCEADGRSLLLLDELGTGTDPLEGAALGLALLKRLVSGGVGCGALTVATTHHSVMTGLKFEDPRVENASVEFDESALAPTYRLLWGIPGRSNALNIAARLGLDARVVSAARSRLDSGVADVNSAIEQLEELRGQLERQERAREVLDQDIGVLTRKLQSMSARVQRLHDSLSRARTEALLQVYTLARERIRAIKKEKKRLGRTASPPKPLLAQQPEPQQQAGAQQAAEGKDEVDGSVEWPSEEEVWAAWE